MNLTILIIQLLCGALGGNAAGSLMKKQSLGPERREVRRGARRSGREVYQTTEELELATVRA